MNSQDGLSEGQLKDLESKGTAALGEATGPLVGCLAKEYQEVSVIGEVYTVYILSILVKVKLLGNIKILRQVKVIWSNIVKWNNLSFSARRQNTWLSLPRSERFRAPVDQL